MNSSYQNCTLSLHQRNGNGSLFLFVEPDNGGAKEFNCTKWIKEGSFNISTLKPTVKVLDKSRGFSASCISISRKYCKTEASFDTNNCTLLDIQNKSEDGIDLTKHQREDVQFTCMGRTEPSDNNSIPIDNGLQVWAIVIIAAIVLLLAVLIVLLVLKRVRRDSGEKNKKRNPSSSTNASHIAEGNGDPEVAQETTNNPLYGTLNHGYEYTEDEQTKQDETETSRSSTLLSTTGYQEPSEIQDTAESTKESHLYEEITGNFRSPAIDSPTTANGGSIPQENSFDGTEASDNESHVTYEESYVTNEENHVTNDVDMLPEENSTEETSVYNVLNTM